MHPSIKFMFHNSVVAVNVVLRCSLDSFRQIAAIKVAIEPNDFSRIVSYSSYQIATK